MLFVLQERFTRAVNHRVSASLRMSNVFAFGYRLDGSTQSIDQAVVDPGRITPAWINRQGFIFNISAQTWRDQLTPDIDWAGVALSLGTAGSSELTNDLIDGYRAEIHRLVRDWSVSKTFDHSRLRHN